MEQIWCETALILHIILLAGSKSYSDAHFGRGSGVIWLDNLHCVGMESDLFNCTHDGIGVYSYHCSHDDDAGVECRLNGE